MVFYILFRGIKWCFISFSEVLNGDLYLFRGIKWCFYIFLEVLNGVLYLFRGIKCCFISFSEVLNVDLYLFRGIKWCCFQWESWWSCHCKRYWYFLHVWTSPCTFLWKGKYYFIFYFINNKLWMSESFTSAQKIDYLRLPASLCINCCILKSLPSKNREITLPEFNTREILHQDNDNWRLYNRDI